ncbi:MAG: hypothetical protein ACI8YQ_002715 [Polaribacter sp.]|jgi:hypothetical protein
MLAKNDICYSTEIKKAIKVRIQVTQPICNITTNFRRSLRLLNLRDLHASIQAGLVNISQINIDF